MGLLTYRLAVRWTVGDVSASGFEALRLSIPCALRVFGDRTRYVVCVNSVGLTEAKARTGPVLRCVEWLDNSRGLSRPLATRLDKGMGEGVGWKLAPLRLFPALHELSLDNDVILWRMPRRLLQWLAQSERCLLAQDVERCLGQFDEDCPEGAYNSGIRGLPPEFNFERAMQTVIARHERRTRKPLLLTSELDEQGLHPPLRSPYLSGRKLLHPPPRLASLSEQAAEKRLKIIACRPLPSYGKVGVRTGRTFPAVFRIFPQPAREQSCPVVYTVRDGA
jgi:hypothetical protein